MAILSNDGMADDLVVDVGGFLGLNEYRVLVKWSDVTIRHDGHATVVATSMDKAQLETLPEYELPASQ